MECVLLRNGSFYQLGACSCTFLPISLPQQSMLKLEGWPGSWAGTSPAGSFRVRQSSRQSEGQQVRAKWRQVPPWRPDQQASPVDHPAWISPRSTGHSPPLGGCFQLVKSAAYVEPFSFLLACSLQMSLCVY